MNRINNIVLVHGFWADGSSYNQITAQLLSEGYAAIAVQNPLTSLADDLAAPNWYIVSSQDQAVPPELQFNLAERMGAKTVVLASGHVPTISHASEVLEVIREASNRG